MSDRVTKILLAALFAVCWTLAPAASAHDFGRLQGKVTDNLGAPIRGTLISVKGPKGKFNVRADDDTGDYSLKLPAGKYRVFVRERPGFAAYKRANVRVVSGKSSVLNIVPESRIYYEDCQRGLLEP